MTHKQVSHIRFDKQNYLDVLDVINELAELEQRKPHDTARRLILEAGREKITKVTGNVNAATEKNGQAQDSVVTQSACTG